jgi:hypothetical protein
VRGLARDDKEWHKSAKAVPVMRVAMAVASIASAMLQAAESADEATEPVREACGGEEKEGDPPHLSRSSLAQPRIISLPPSSSA